MTQLELKLESLVPYAGGRVEVEAVAWWLPLGGGALSCSTDLLGRASGAGCGYLYPGQALALVGSWLEGRMASAGPAPCFKKVVCVKVGAET